MMEPVIVVLGKNYSTSLSIIRALGKEGYRVELYYIAQKKGDSIIASSSKFLNRTIEHIGRTDNEIIEDICQIYSDPNRTYVLLPTDDYTSSLIDRYKNKLRLSFITPYMADQEAGYITHCMSKDVQAEMAKRIGINVAKYWKIYLPKDGQINIPSDIPMPCFLKPIVSAKGYKIEISKCSSSEELNKKLAVMRKRMSERFVMVQEYLEISEEYAISGASIDKEIIMPALNKKIVVGQHDNGVTVIGEIANMELITSIKDKIIQLLQSFHYVGLFDIDLIRCGNEIYFGEINFRSSGIGYSVIHAGVNLPKIIVKALCGECWKNENLIPQYGLKFFYDKTGWEDVVYGYRKWDEMMSYMSMADFSLIDVQDDPVPGRMFMNHIKKSYNKYKAINIIPIPFFRKILKRILR